MKDLIELTDAQLEEATGGYWDYNNAGSWQGISADTTNVSLFNNGSVSQSGSTNSQNATNTAKQNSGYFAFGGF